MHTWPLCARLAAAASPSLETLRTTGCCVARMQWKIHNKSHTAHSKSQGRCDLTPHTGRPTPLYTPLQQHVCIHKLTPLQFP